jgi:hypothetical protein
MAPKETKISEQGVAGITTHIILTIMETLDMITKTHSIIMAAHMIGLLTTLGRNTRRNFL